ncbi:MAG: hypothetical protein KME17_21365 [Cyanosarcina radialis HA8281-LM2]|jgi:hypothetical protein|nr:hypothetical protein [Cyanosarcina radialis HA8281-LM2]
MTQDFEIDETLVVRYHKWLGISFTVLGGINTFLWIWLLLLTKNFSLNLITGIIILTVGILYLTKPYFSIEINKTYIYKESNKIYFYNLLGMKIKEYSFNSWQDLTVEQNKVYLQGNDREKKLPIVKWMTNKDDWKILESRINRQEELRWRKPVR